jgi:tetratricopeptide (TPR) repeat protein
MPGERGPIDLIRREFLARCCQGAGAALIPSGLRGLALDSSRFASIAPQASTPSFHLHPHYRTERPLDGVLLKVPPGNDDFVSEKYAAQIEDVLRRWSDGLKRSPFETRGITNTLAADFSGTSPKPIESRVKRTSPALQVREITFDPNSALGAKEFIRDFRSLFSGAPTVLTAEFQITSIRVANGLSMAVPAASEITLDTVVRYELVSTGPGCYRQQRVGYWNLQWVLSFSGDALLRHWRWTNETHCRAASPTYLDVTAAALGGNSSYSSQLQHGTDYWRTVLDGACGIDIYGHNGVSVADIDNDGFDDLYVCQPAGLPNRLYRNRGDGTFEDITESSGLGLLENTACALFADFDNDGRQDVIVVRAKGPVFFANEGGGKFREKADAFQFANPPQGTFTGASVADYDRDGWLDIYFCLYGYYQGTGPYRYPSPYHDAENGPPNFMMRNNREGTFRDVTAECGLNKNNSRFSFCCGWCDYNGDGWPDLYVVNDFGRKNLYSNNGDGTFTDLAHDVGVEDVGAGMGVCWADYDNDGKQDLYVANMWTAAGERIAEQENFQAKSPADVRALYQKHAMGNSLFRNLGNSFADNTTNAGVGMGRWAWSSDCIDFDHDGFFDLYVVNGMVSGPSKTDLNSFFWRQVVASSPEKAASSAKYEEGWSAINELIRSDETWSGYERNVFYANNGDGTFSDVSGVLGVDFVEDGRAFAIADFDGDGRQEIFLKNRNAPQLRILKNAIADLPPSIAFRLVGKKSNRDAIGASISIETELGRQTRMLQVGSGFLSQHSKDLMFGLGAAKNLVNASIRWPNGLVQELRDLPHNHRVIVEEGSSPPHVEPFRTLSARERESQPMPQQESEILPDNVETWLLEPIAAPEFELFSLAGQTKDLASSHGEATLLSFWVADSDDCKQNLLNIEKQHRRWATLGLHTLTVNLDESDQKQKEQTAARVLGYTFPILLGSDDVAGVYNILHRQLFDRHRDLSLPTSFLLSRDREIVKVYRGPIAPETVEKDFQRIPQTDDERLKRVLPFSIPGQKLEFGRNHLSYGSLYFQRGYLDQAEASFKRALRDDPSSAEAAYGIGSVYLKQEKDAAARESFQRAVKLKAGYPGTMADAWNNLGVLATREGRAEESVKCFSEALQTDPNHLLALDNLGNAYRLQKKWNEAREVLERALAINPEDAEANYSLGMIFAQTDDNVHAYEYLQKALKARPTYPEALNNLGVLYLVTERTEQAVETFRKCIEVAPAFDQAYLNLARVYALQGARDEARAVLVELLKMHPGHGKGSEMMDQLER